jgi:hypothetical protein
LSFADWVLQSGMTQSAVAVQLKTSQGHVNDLMQNKNWPTRSMAVRILTLTNGLVTPNDFLGIEQKRIRRAR